MLGPVQSARPAWYVCDAAYEPRQCFQGERASTRLTALQCDMEPHTGQSEHTPSRELQCLTNYSLAGRLRARRSTTGDAQFTQSSFSIPETLTRQCPIARAASGHTCKYPPSPSFPILRSFHRWSIWQSIKFSSPGSLKHIMQGYCFPVQPSLPWPPFPAHLRCTTRLAATRAPALRDIIRPLVVG